MVAFILSCVSFAQQVTLKKDERGKHFGLDIALDVIATLCLGYLLYDLVVSRRSQDGLG